MMIGGLTKRQLVLEAINYRSNYWNPSMVVFYAISIVLCTIGIRAILKKKYYIYYIFIESHLFLLPLSKIQKNMLIVL